MLNTDQTGRLAETFRLPGEPNRLSPAMCCPDGRHGVGDLTGRVGISQSLVSHHLRLLRAARLLKAVREGKQVFYAIADDPVRGMLSNMIDHMTGPHPAGPEAGQDSRASPSNT